MKKFLFDSKSVGELPSNPAAGIPDRLPFVLDDNFEPVEEINRWLHLLPQRGCYSARTWNGYADDLVAWARFLQGRGNWLFDPSSDLQAALAEYRSIRLQGAPDGSFRLLSPSAWNRAVAALENFYSWAVDESRISSKPFRYKQVRVFRGARAGTTAAQNFAKAKAGSRLATIKYLAPDFANVFVQTGLGGSLLDGSPDLSFSGQLAVRNQAMGSLVRSSGLRRQEFSNLLVWEVPTPLSPFSDYVALSVPTTIAKGARSRVTWASNAALEDVHSYITLEHATATDRSEWKPENPLYVEAPGALSGLVNGRRVLWAKLTIEQRRRLVTPAGGSALLFVRSNGAPVEENNWRYTFQAATLRCRALVSNFPTVTPHTLRHTFAMETLNDLTRGALSRSERLAKISGADPLLMAVIRRNDPLLVLRDLLGHQSVLTTEVYLAAQTPEAILTNAELELLDETDGPEELALST